MVAGAAKEVAVTNVDTCMSQEPASEVVSQRKKLKSSPVVSQAHQSRDSLNELRHNASCWLANRVL